MIVSDRKISIIQLREVIVIGKSTKHSVSSEHHNDVPSPLS